MFDFLTSGDEIEFSPAGGWHWVPPFAGVVVARPAADRPAQVLGKQILVQSDLEQLARELEDKAYTADGFPNPGKVDTARVLVNAQTLARLCHLIDGVPAVRVTEGTFQVSCSPPASNPSNGATDASPARSGTWRVRAVQQSLARSVCSVPMVKNSV